MPTRTAATAIMFATRSARRVRSVGRRWCRDLGFTFNSFARCGTGVMTLMTGTVRRTSACRAGGKRPGELAGWLLASSGVAHAANLDTGQTCGCHLSFAHDRFS